MICFRVAFAVSFLPVASAFSISSTSHTKSAFDQLRHSSFLQKTKNVKTPSMSSGNNYNLDYDNLSYDLYDTDASSSSSSIEVFDPCNFSSSNLNPRTTMNLNNDWRENYKSSTNNFPLAISTILLTSLPSTASAAVQLDSGAFNPATFKPVCSTSDSFYRFLQITTQSIIGEDNFVEYGPLIAEGLLRIRLELCVVESYFNEAVGPFIERKGLSWVLPLHETVETFVAGSIFALASTFILVGSTKIVTVVFTYADIFIGGPCRLLGGFAFDRSRGKPVIFEIGFGPFKTRLIGPPKEKSVDSDKKSKEDLGDWELGDDLDPKNIPLLVVSGVVKLAGETSKITRELLEGLDLFVGRYLTLFTTGYIGIKFLHFKVFPDFPPF